MAMNATWANQVLMCFPKIIRYPKGVPADLIGDARDMNEHPDDAGLKKQVIGKVQKLLDSRESAGVRVFSPCYRRL